MSRGPAPGPASVLRGHQSDVQALAFHPGLDVLYSGDAAGELRNWNLASRRSAATEKLHCNAAGIIGLTCLQSAEGVMLISQDREGTVRIWALAQDGTLADSGPLREFCTHSYTFCRCSVLGADASSNAQDDEPSDATGLVAAPGEDPATAEVWGIQMPADAAFCPLQAAARLATYRLPLGVNYGMCMSMHAFRHGGLAYLAVGYEAGHVAVWQLSVAAQPLMASQLHKEAVMALAIDSSASGGISGGAEKAVMAFSMDLEARTMAVRKTLELRKEGVSDAVLRPDGRVFAIGGWDGRVRLYSYRKATPLAILKYHKAGVTAVAFSKAHLLASAARDGSVALWSVYDAA